MSDARKSVWARMAEANPRRSLILFACGAIFGLTIAGLGLFTAAGTRVSGVPPEDVALVNGRHILKSDFIAQIETETAQPFDMTTKEQRAKVLNDMLNEELLVQRGLEIDLAASDPDVRLAMATGVQLLVDADVIAQQPPDAQLQAYYDANKDKYGGEGIMALRDLVLHMAEGDSKDAMLAKAAKAAEAFRKGDTPDNVAATFGMMDSGVLDRGDLFEFAVKIKLSPDLYTAARELMPNQASEPIARPDGVHVLLMEKRTIPEQRSFAEARDAVMQDFKREEQARVEAANLTYLKSKADIQLAPEFAP